MAEDPNDKKSESAVSGEGKLAWVHPTVEMFRARDADIIANPYGGPDAAIYTS